MVFFNKCVFTYIYQIVLTIMILFVIMSFKIIHTMELVEAPPDTDSLKLQLWVLSGVVSTLFIAVVYFVKVTFNRINKNIEEMSIKINKLDKDLAVNTAYDINKKTLDNAQEKRIEKLEDSIIELQRNAK